MKRLGATLCLVLLTSGISYAADWAQITVDASVETAKAITIQVMKEAGYKVNSQYPGSVVFSKELTGRQRTFVLDVLSPVACDCMSPLMSLTVNFSERDHGTLETISAAIVHTQLVVRGAEINYNPWINPHITADCETVRESPIFMHTQKLLNGLLQQIGSKTVHTYAGLNP